MYANTVSATKMFDRKHVSRKMFLVCLQLLVYVSMQDQHIRGIAISKTGISHFNQLIILGRHSDKRTYLFSVFSTDAYLSKYLTLHLVSLHAWEYSRKTNECFSLKVISSSCH